ncbi:MAG: IS66 family insertion sequence element accessory protein TnpA [Terriglobia bacterium]
MARRKSPEPKTPWNEWAAQWKRSGQSVAAFCRQRGLNASSLYAWRNRHRAVESLIPRPADFLPVTVIPAEPEAQVEIELRGGRVLRLLGQVTPSRLAAIVAALEGRPC